MLIIQDLSQRNTILHSACTWTAHGREYTGTVAKDQYDYTCQQWTSQSPNAHSFVADDFPDDSLADAQNHCRFVAISCRSYHIRQLLHHESNLRDYWTTHLDSVPMCLNN